MTIPPRTRVPRSLVVLMFLQFAVGGAVLPFIALLFRDRGLDFTQVSRIFSGACMMLLFFPFFWGMLADRFVSLNRLFVVLNALIIVLLLLFEQQTRFAGLMILFMLFYACLNPSFVLLSPLSFHYLDNPRTQFGRLRAWGSLGWIVPSLLIYAGLALMPGSTLGITLYLGAIISSLAIAAALYLPTVPPGSVPVMPVHPESPETHQPISYPAAVRRLLKSPGYRTALVIYSLVASSFAIQAIYSAPLLEDLGLNRKWIGPSQCIGVVLEIILFRWQSRLLGRISIAGTILIGVVAMVVRQALFWWSDNLWLLVGSHLLTGVVIVYHHIGMSVLVNAMAPREVRSTAQTLLILCGSGIGPMLANLSVGWITAESGQNLRMVFAFATGLAVAGGLVLLWRFKPLNRAVSTPPPGA